jgi:hypothetical protein
MNKPTQKDKLIKKRKIMLEPIENYFDREELFAEGGFNHEQR